MRLFRLLLLFLFALFASVAGAKADASFWTVSGDGVMTLVVGSGEIEESVPADVVALGALSPCHCFEVVWGDKRLTVLFPERPSDNSKDARVSVEAMGYGQQVLRNILLALKEIGSAPEVSFRTEGSSTGFYFEMREGALWLAADFFSIKPEDIADLFRKK